MMKVRKSIFFLFLVVSACLVIFVVKQLGSNSWASFISDGVISSRMFKKFGTIVYGTYGQSHPQIYFLKTFGKNIVETIDLNTGDAIPQAFSGSNILVTSDDTLISVNIYTKKIAWQVSSDEQKFFKKIIVYDNKILASCADGSLYVFAPKDGKLLWKFKPQNVDNLLSSIMIDANLNYFGDFTVEGKVIYLASADKSAYAININNGHVIWSTNIGAIAVSEPMVYGRYLYVTTYSGDTFAVNKHNGKIIWHSLGKSQINCFEVRSAFKNYNNPISQFVSYLLAHFKNISTVGRLSYYELHKDGTFIKRDAKTGSIIWQSETLPSNLNCPTFWKSKVALTGNKGNFIIIDTQSGKKIYDQNTYGKMVAPAIVEQRFDKFIPEWLDVFTPNYYIYNTEGDIFKIRGSTTQTLWKFSAKAPTNTVVLIDGASVYFPTSDGVVYKIDKRSGSPLLSRYEKKFDVVDSVKKVSSSNIHEFTLKSNSDFINPWRQANMDATFTHESGLVVNVPGFYYDKNVWKLRFNPPLKGSWKWKITWSPHGKDLFKSGEFISDTDTSEFYIRNNTINPKRLTTDGKNIFNGIGMGDTMIDYNYNGTTLDDWTIGNSTPIVATDSAGITVKYRSDKINSLDDYISTYGPKGAGFNIFRWSLMNASESLWTNLGYPTTYSILQGKVGDTLAESLRSNDIHLWFTAFGFDIPYKYSVVPRDQYLLKSYIRYVYARYGAYVDVWELANEIAVPKDTATLLFNEIRSYDFEKRPISISSVEYNYEQSEIIAPHWYETEKIEESDTKTSSHILTYDKIEKPVVIAEQGNHKTNYDETSAIRMRIRSWTAYFEQGILMFWNQSDSKDYTSGIFSANIYLGDEERSYIRVLQELTKSFPLKSESVRYNLNGIRGYGLIADDFKAAYFYHYSSPFTVTSFTLPLSTKLGGNMQWVDPSTGKVLKSEYCKPFKCMLTSPEFKTDVVLLLK